MIDYPPASNSPGFGVGNRLYLICSRFEGNYFSKDLEVCYLEDPLNKSKKHKWEKIIIPAFELAECPNPRQGAIHCTVSKDEVLCLRDQVAVIYNDRTKSVKSFTYDQDFDFKTDRV